MATEIIKIDRAHVAIVNNRALEQLPPAERKIVEAALAPRISQLKKEDAEIDMVNMLTTIYTIAGQKADAATLAIYAPELYNKVLETYPYVTLEEIRIALKKGVYGDFGEYGWLSLKTFFSFVRYYIESEQRKLAGESFRTQKALLSVQTTSFEDKVKVSTDYTNELYMRFLIGSLELNFLPGFIYDFLLYKGLLSDKLDYTRARLYYSENIDKDKSRFLRASMMGDGKETERAAAIRIVAQQMAIWDYFTLCKAYNKVIIVSENV